MAPQYNSTGARQKRRRLWSARVLPLRGRKMNFSKAHFIGIAGKGMSATALLLKQMGVQISGSDEGFYPPVSDYLKSANVAFAQGYRKENIPDDAEVII